MSVLRCKNVPFLLMTIKQLFRLTPNCSAKLPNLILLFNVFIILLLNIIPVSCITVCRTPACISAGKWLHESIDYSVYPCNDFYEFACGNWKALNPIPAESPYTTLPTIIQRKVSTSLRKILEEGPAKWRGLVARSVQFSVDLYHQCVDQETRNKLGLDPYRNLLWTVLGTSWPIVNSEQMEQLNNYNNLSLIEFFMRFEAIGVNSIVNLATRRGGVISFNFPEFGLTHKMLGKSKDISRARKYRHEILKLFSGMKTNKKLLKMRLDEMFQFESQLVLASTPIETQEAHGFWKLKVNPMSLYDFKRLTSNHIDWTAYLNQFSQYFNLPYSFIDANWVNIQDTPYYITMAQLVAQTPPHVLYNYMGFEFIRRYSGLGNSQLKDINFQSYKAKTGVKEARPAWMDCLFNVNRMFPVAISRLYVDNYVLPGTKKRAKEMITDLRGAFRQIIETETNWLDEPTRVRALEKVNATHFDVAYPEWILNNTELDELYYFNGYTAPISVKAGQVLETVRQVKQFYRIKLFQNLLKPYKRSRTANMLGQPTEVNAFARHLTNTVALTAAILQPPFFDPRRPAYLNYGAIGQTIGHEITHHFDGEGRKYDKYGYRRNWWSSETLSRFNEGAKCFVEQYGANVDLDTGIRINGTFTIGENIADNGAIRQAFYAFQANAQRNPMQLVPQMETFTTEQLFFLSFAQSQCSNYRLEAAKKNLEENPHSPERYRTNVVLSNFEPFAKAYGCQIGSPMNPVKKCRLW